MKMSEFKTIETQEELDNIVKERIRREREKFSDYDELKKRVSELESENSALKSTVEDDKQTRAGLDAQITELQGQVSNYETANLRTRIALQNGLPYDLADRLQGADEEALKADAERLAGFMRPATHQAPLRDTEPPIGDDKTMQMKQMLRELQPKGE
ncbi:gp39 [Streptococcus pneumoniae]|nr:gp39 [Streptococcus pneumoniae]VRC46139.1 gp39 [Streptococcus pneumoniae]VRH18823.1 gp39 [Streptococcus pneumoniae]